LEQEPEPESYGIAAPAPLKLCVSLQLLLRTVRIAEPHYFYATPSPHIIGNTLIFIQWHHNISLPKFLKHFKTKLKQFFVRFKTLAWNIM
jgi:hypothetical protein